MANTRWEDIFNHLKTSGYDVYPPGVKEGKCTKSYIVVKDAGISEAASVSSNLALYDVMLYVPKHAYSTLEGFKNDVQAVMDGLFPMIRPTHFVSTSFYDETVDAWMVSVQYQNVQKKVRA